MNNREFEIENKVITIEQIKKCSDYLQQTCQHYNNLINQDLEKNNHAYFSSGEYKYYAFIKPVVKYTIRYTDGREVDTIDEITFQDALSEPQYLKEISLYLYVSFQDNEENEATEHTMSISLGFHESFISFSTSDQHMFEQANEMNHSIKNILESGEDRYSDVVKNKFLIKNVIGLAVGSILTLVLFFLLLFLRSQGNDMFETLFANALVLSLLGWVIAFAFGMILIQPVIENLFHEIDQAESVYSYAGLMKNYEKEYKRKNEVLIGTKYHNLEKRNTIRKMYAISKKILLVRVLISFIIILVLSIV